MVILKQGGLGWSILNIVLVAVVLYFAWLALNRWVFPFNTVATNGNGGEGAGTGTTRGANPSTGRYKICKDAAGTSYQWYSNKPCPSIYV